MYENGEERVVAGDFFHKHWSGGDNQESALSCEKGPGKFDFNPVN